MQGNELTCVDLFAGAGGLGLGLERAGFRTVAVVEKNAIAGNTYQKNLVTDPNVITAFGDEEGDIRNIDFGEVAEELKARGVTRVDLVAGGPPCQGFSKAGRGKLNHLDDDLTAFSQDARNSLVFDFCRAVRVLRPRAVLIENVVGILNLGGENHANLVCRELRALGYRVKVTLLNSAWYGVPQNRERFFLFGLADDVEDPSTWFPTPLKQGRNYSRMLVLHELRKAGFDDPSWVEMHLPEEDLPGPVSVEEAFRDLPVFTRHLWDDAYACGVEANPPTPYGTSEPSAYGREMRNWPGLPVAKVCTHHYCRNTARDFETFRRMKQGALYPDAVKVAADRYQEAVDRWDESSGRSQPVPEDFIPPYPLGSFDERWQKLIYDEPSWTVTAHLSRDCYSHIHPDDEQARTISVREAARLQSFPDSYSFVGNTGECYQQIGNAVPPLLGFRLGEALARHLEKQRGRKESVWHKRPVPSASWLESAG